MDWFSDTGSIPVASTRKNEVEILGSFFILQYNQVKIIYI